MKKGVKCEGHGSVDPACTCACERLGVSPPSRCGRCAAANAPFAWPSGEAEQSERFFLHREGGRLLAVLEGERALRCLLPVLSEKNLVKLGRDLGRARRLSLDGRVLSCPFFVRVGEESWWWSLEVREGRA